MGVRSGDYGGKYTSFTTEVSPSCLDSSIAAVSNLHSFRVVEATIDDHVPKY